ncbi:hypothetical protein [Nonomuraea sp. NPDC049309]|uniref:hypothetical protein n=1 Tax=Nonomuraea sp. NPDC049309 TaxID=3364350 RepID=UPI0037206018
MRKWVCIVILALMGLDVLYAATDPDAGIDSLGYFIFLGFLLAAVLSWDEPGSGSSDYGGGGASYGGGDGGFGGDGGDGGE